MPKKNKQQQIRVIRQCPGCGLPTERKDMLICEECEKLAKAECTSETEQHVELQGFWPRSTVKALMTNESKSPETYKTVGGVRYVFRDGFVIRQELE